MEFTSYRVYLEMTERGSGRAGVMGSQRRTRVLREGQ